MSQPSISHGDEIGSKWFPGIGTLKVSVRRTATLTDDLTAIRSRRFMDILLTTDRDDRPPMRLDLEEAEWLTTALDAAVAAGKRGKYGVLGGGIDD